MTTSLPTDPGATSPSGFDLAAADRLLTTTRAVRRRLDLGRPVGRDVVLECLRIATHAPSGGNSQPWRWLAVDEPEVRRGLAELYRQAYGPYLEMQKAAIAQAGGDPDSAIVRSSDYLAAHLHEVPVFVIPCLLARLPADASQADTAGFYGSILPAVWSFMLALRSRGLGSVFTTLHLHREREAAELLGIPDTVTQVALLPVAYTTGGDFTPADRKPVEAVTYWNGWRNRG
ncbi:MAG TPA: nitroreductase family protein [Acidimicrobiales bacterium]|nr:nitroreductase family protein [Acidimicrobiales bacterium]